MARAGGCTYVPEKETTDLEAAVQWLPFESSEFVADGVAWTLVFDQTL